MLQQASEARLLDDYLSEEQAAAEINVKARTLQRWRSNGCAPPYIIVGRVPYYRRDAIAEWLRGLEK
jgi:hypothetical protein